jgi:DNA-binding FadR family transcriptional regulator
MRALTEDSMNTADRIYAASTSEEAETARLAEKLARQMEDDIASGEVPAGGMMGSLRELSERYAVGRAAVREAVGLLERRGLGRLRPGPYGGFIVARPDADTVSTELANYFRLAGTTLDQLRDARTAVDLTAAGIAAVRCKGGGKPALPSPGKARDCLDWHLQLRTQIAQLSAEPALELFCACTNELSLDFASGAGAAPDWPDEAGRIAAVLAAALADGDQAATVALAEQVDTALSRLLSGSDIESSPRPVIEQTQRLEDDRTLAALVARRIAAEIAEDASAGQRIGSEWDLCERYSVSRTTLRQAIRQLQDTGLVECRRGRGNGLVVRNQRGTGSIRLALAYLIGQHMDPLSAGTLLFQLNRFVPALAVSRAGPRQRQHLEVLLDTAQRSDPLDRYDLLRLVQGVSLLADSPILDLFSRCLAAYEARFHPFLIDRLPRDVQAEYFGLLRRLLDERRASDEAYMRTAKDSSAQVMLEMSRSRPI